MKRLLFIFFVVMLLTNVALADDPTVEASVSSNKISLKEGAALTLTFTGAKQISADALILPKVDGLDIRPGGSESTQISIVNGKYSSQRSFTFSLFPTRVGTIHLPAMIFTVDGKDCSTQPIDIEVTDAPAASAPDTNQPSTSTENIKDRLFMVVSTPKAKVYIGQKVPVAIKLFVNQLPVRNVQFPKFDKNGFTMDAFPQPPQYTQTLNGVKYDVVEFKTNIYPARVGEVAVGPIEIQASLLYKMSNQRTGNGFFDDDFFNNFLGNVQERPVAVHTDALNLNVLDVPSEGKPADFSGAVGQANFEASISPAQVKVGDPVTLRMKLTGDVNVKSVAMPQLNDSNFKTYDPQIKDDAAGKTLEQIIIPTVQSVTEVPAFHFTYFDTASGEYKTLTQGPFPLKVSAPVAGQEFKAVGFTNLPAHVGAEAPPVDYIQKYIINPFSVVISFIKKPICWIIVLILALCGGVWTLWRRFRNRLKTDTGFYRHVNALKRAKEGLKETEEHLKKTSSLQEFYACLAKVLINYLGDKLDKPVGSLTVENVAVLLSAKKVPAEQITAVTEMMDIADFIRFSGNSIDATRKSSDLAKVQALIVSLDKSLK